MECRDCKPGKLCRWHLRRLAAKSPQPLKRTPIKKKPKRINPRSAKKIRDDRVYKILRLIFLALIPVCERCKVNKSTDVHHKRGRGIWYLVVETWLAMCRDCHREVTDNSKQAIADGWSERRNS